MPEAATDAAAPAPLVVRVAGLPGSALEGLRGDAPSAALDHCDTIETELASQRQALVDRLHASIGGETAERRRILLAIKRDAFNGRALGRHRRSDRWPLLIEVAGGIAERVAELEDQLDEATRRFEAVLDAERIRQREGLRACLDDRGFVRGVALSSRLVASQLHRLRVDPSSAYNRRQRRLEVSLLRYVSRAASKLSPYSTLTKVGLGRVTDAVDGIAWSGSDTTWRDTSLVRLKRYILEQAEALLLARPSFAETLEVVLNDSLRASDDGTFRYVRPDRWVVEHEPPNVSFRKDQLLRVKLGGELIEWLITELPRAPRRLEALRHEIVETFPDATREGTRTTIGRLVDIGFLILRPPWQSVETVLEDAMVRHLAARPDAEAYRDLIDALRQIVELEQAFAGDDRPAELLEALDRAIDRVWTTAAPLAGLPVDAARPSAARGRIYEDVVSSGPSASGEILSLAESRARDLLRDAEPVHRLFDAFHPRYEFLLALDHFMAERWPEVPTVPVLDVLPVAHALWVDYRKHELAGRQPEHRGSIFDPYELPTVDALRRVRAALREQLDRCIRPTGDELELVASELEAILDRLPTPLRPTIGPCLLLQPADRRGERWVLNRVFEGTGRYASRYSSAMPTSMRDHFLHHMASHAAIEIDGERVELLDLLCIRGDTLNIRGIQTPRVLDLPGVHVDLPAACRVDVRDLHIERRAGALPRLVDREHQPLLPVHLGGVGLDFTPNLVKFLALLGPTDVPQMPLPRAGHMADGIEILPRLRCGSLILERKAWILPREHFPTLPDSTADAYRALRRWRLERHLPDRAFFIDKIHDPLRDDLHKPQYMDFTSPLFLELFRASLKNLEGAGSPLILTELLPTLDELPRDARDQPRAVEVQLDSLAMPAG